MILCCLVCSTIHSPFAKTLYCYNISSFAKEGSPSLLSELTFVQGKIQNTFVADSILEAAEERYALQACPSLPLRIPISAAACFFHQADRITEMWSWRWCWISSMQWGWHKDILHDRAIPAPPRIHVCLYLPNYLPIHLFDFYGKCRSRCCHSMYGMGFL